MSVATVTNLLVDYGGVRALNGVSLDIPAGGIIGVLGPNGSGKTTLFKTMAGLIRPYKGEILIGGNRPGAETKAIVSYLPEKTYLSDWMRPADALNLFSDYYADFDRHRADDMLAAFGVEGGKRIKQMSKGMQEKLQMILVLARNAKLYLLDEPLGGIDPSARAGMLSEILRNYNPEASVLIATHLIHDVERVFNRVLFLKNGQIVLDEDSETLRERTGKGIEDVFKEVFPWSVN